MINNSSRNLQQKFAETLCYANHPSQGMFENMNTGKRGLTYQRADFDTLKLKLDSVASKNITKINYLSLNVDLISFVLFLAGLCAKY